MAAQIAQGSGGPPVVVIANGVDTNAFHPDIIKSPLWEDAAGRASLVLGMVGRIHPNKGQMEFVKAAAIIAKARSDCRFLIVGEAPPGYETYKMEVLKFIETEGLGKIVTITKATRDQIPGIMSSLDILVAPSFTESFSFALIEAMATAKPIVSTNSGGTPELITHNETGILIEPGNVENLAHTLFNLINDSARRMRLGEAARKYVVRNLSVEAMATRTLNVYREVINWRQLHRTVTSRATGLSERLQHALVLDER
jgi:glycosyltransferase involved in cell wall biosynthesis